MKYRTYDEKWDNARIPWIRASDIHKQPYEIQTPVRPLYYRAAALMFIYGVMYIALLYIACVIYYVTHSSLRK